MADMTVFDAIDRLRAAWRFKTDPVPDEAIRRILDAATKAASGGNSQPWRFVVVRDPALRAEVGRRYAQAWSVYRGAVERVFGGRLDEQGRSMIVAAEALAKSFGAVPVHLLVCMGPLPAAFVLRDEAGASLDAGSVYSSIFPAVQNIILAATALGLATRLITLHKIVEGDLKDLLGIPKEVEIPALLPLGYPDGTFKRRPRLPLEAVTHWDRWKG
jgi:nitroreductase